MQEQPLFKTSPTILNLMASHIWAVTSSNTIEITAQVTSLHIVPTYTSLHSFDLQLLLAVNCEIRMIRPTFTRSTRSICHVGPPVDHYISVLDYDQNSTHTHTHTHMRAVRNICSTITSEFSKHRHVRHYTKMARQWSGI